MTKEIAIIGIGTTGFRATTPDLSFRELTYEAAKKAYMDAGVEPKEIGAFVATSEDFCEGYSIADEYAPDQVGAVLRPIYTVQPSIKGAFRLHRRHGNEPLLLRDRDLP
jgi:acetyl-CoA C-acetyltransferase